MSLDEQSIERVMLMSLVDQTGHYVAVCEILAEQLHFAHFNANIINFDQIDFEFELGDSLLLGI